MNEQVHYDKKAYHSSGRYLWRTVLHRAQLEADGKHLLVTNHGDSKEKIRQRAIRWLTTDSWDLRTIWYLAQLPPRGYYKFLESERAKWLVT